MIITQTPLRISFLGGGTDFAEYYRKEEGYVLSTAIDKYIFVIVNERFDDMIYVNYSRKERVDSPEKIEHDLVREAMLKTGTKNGVEITILADIPSEGSGLGSSSSLIVGLLNALYIYKGIQVTAKQLAEEACDIEINICKRPIGKQDQYIAAFGGLCTFNFKKNEEVVVNKIEISDSSRRKFASNLLLFFTGLTRSSSSILTEQKENIKDKTAELNIIKKLALNGEQSILKGDLENIGNLLNENWNVKKKLSKSISNTTIDEMYNKALSAGASGGKISGAGGGGFLLLYCKSSHKNSVREELKKFREMPFLLEKDGSKVIFNYRRYSWK
jgi:D-glycero-alpha-D-manno-heptose-7-phosphate kinase